MSLLAVAGNYIACSVSPGPGTYLMFWFRVTSGAFIRHKYSSWGRRVDSYLKVPCSYGFAIHQNFTLKLNKSVLKNNRDQLNSLSSGALLTTFKADILWYAVLHVIVSDILNFDGVNMVNLNFLKFFHQHFFCEVFGQSHSHHLVKESVTDLLLWWLVTIELSRQRINIHSNMFIYWYI